MQHSSDIGPDDAVVLWLLAPILGFVFLRASWHITRHLLFRRKWQKVRAAVIDGRGSHTAHGMVHSPLVVEWFDEQHGEQRRILPSRLLSRNVQLGAAVEFYVNPRHPNAALPATLTCPVMELALAGLCLLFLFWR